MSKVLDELYAKHAKLAVEQPFGYKILLRVINKQIEMFERNEKKKE